MSAPQEISFDGEALRRRTPMLAEIQDGLLGMLGSLEAISRCRWADGADDPTTAGARANVRQLFVQGLIPSTKYAAYSTGVPGDKLDAVAQDRANTEDHVGDLAAGWSGGEAGRHG